MHLFSLTHTHTFSYFFFLFVFSTSFILILCHTLITSSLLEIFHMISNLIRLNSSIISSTYTMSALFPFFFFYERNNNAIMRFFWRYFIQNIWVESMRCILFVGIKRFFLSLQILKFRMERFLYRFICIF